jgi:hypothetical protein
VFLSPLEAKADGLVVRTKQTQGPFIVTIFTPPEASRDLPTEVTVMIQRRDSGEVVMDAAVDLSFVPPAGAKLSPNDVLCSPTHNPSSLEAAGAPGQPASIRATRAQAANKLFYGTPVVLRAAGDWQLRAAIRQGGEEASITCTLPVGIPLHWLRGLWPYLALPPVVIALFAINQWLRRRTAKRLSEKSVLGSTGYQPVPSGDSPDEMRGGSDTNGNAPLVSMTTVVPVGGSPTGAGGSSGSSLNPTGRPRLTTK